MDDKNKVVESFVNYNNFDKLEGMEITSQRTEFEKVYDLGLGRRQAITFAEPVHYRGTDGLWHDIDNSLESVVDVDGRPVWRNRANSVDIKFDQHRNQVSFSNKEHTLSWTVLDANASTPIVTEGSELRRNYREQMHLSETEMIPQERRLDTSNKYSSRVEYTNVRPNLSVCYHVSSDHLKEDIILQNANAIEAAALLLPDKYNYIVDNIMRVHVNDKTTGKELFWFGRPYTYDAAGNDTYATVSLEPCADGIIMHYNLTDDYLSNAAYPVTIDPVLYTSKAATAVNDTYIWVKNPNSNYGGTYLMRCGHGSGGESIALIKFLKLTSLRASDTIISAQLRVYPANYGNDSEYVGCYPIKTSWEENTVTWNSMNPSSNSHISDDMIAYITGTTGYRYFDITALYRQWYYTGANNGVALRYPAGLNGTNKYVEWTAAENDSSKCPRVIVNYVSHAGRQNWWSYESMNSGRSGTAYVDLYNGNLVYEHNDGGTSGIRMPISLAHVYNSCLSEYDTVGCGMGWRTTMHQSVHKVTLASIDYYVWTDGSATEHYFPISGSQPYKDSEGMGLKLTTNSSMLTITSKYHSYMQFGLPTSTVKLPLNKIFDALGNYAELTYDAVTGKLSSITDGVGRVISLSYNDSGMLDTLSIPGSPTLTYNYNSAAQLTGINYSDITNGGTVFTYESEESNLLTAAHNFDGLQTSITFESTDSYDSAAIEDYAQQVRRVISLEQINGDVHGAKKIINYLPMATKVTVAEDTDSDKGKSITYQFNNAGNIVCMHDELGFAQSNVYSDTISNQISSSSKLQKVVINKLPNIDFSAGWTVELGNINDAAVRDTTVRCMNMPSVKISKAGEGETTYALTTTVSTAGMYTFSVYIKNDTKLSVGALYARIKTDDTVNSSYAFSSSTVECNSNSSSSGWDRIYVTGYIPVGNVTVELVDTANTGNAWFACPQLETGTISNHVNLLINSDFTRTVDVGEQTFAESWDRGTGISTNSLHGVVAHDDANMPSSLEGNALRIHTYCNTAANAHYQSIPAIGTSGDVFVIGGWVNAASVYSGGTSFKACLLTRFKDANGTWGSWGYHEYDVQRVGWKFAQWAVIAPFNYTEVTFGIQYARNNGTAMFSNLFVHREEFGKSYTYDDNKNVVSVSTLTSQKADMEYDDANNLISYRLPGAASDDKYTADYGSDAATRKLHLPRTTTSPMGVSTVYEYDTAYNNPTSTIIKGNGTDAFIKSATSYTDDGNFVFSKTDARGNAIEYTIDPTYGLTEKVTDPDGHEVSYTYDASKRLTSVISENDGKVYKNTYTYENDRIKTVSHNTTTDTPDVTYTFEYDSLGRKTNVKVGEQLLSTNVYENDRNGMLSEVQYGNGGKVAYSYDEFDRITAVTIDNNTSPSYTYVYGADGRASRVTDAILGRSLETEYDLADRPCRNTIKDTSGNIVYRSTLGYDELSNLVQMREEVNNSANGVRITDFTYDRDNRVTRVQYDSDSTRSVDYTYDNLGRITSRTAINGTNAYATSYTYVDGGYGTNSTTPLVAGITQSGMNFTYTYDSRGNITSETRNGLITTYVYDGIGQLVRVNDPHENATWVYNYDRGGNITSKVKYAYTTGTLGFAVQTISYTYDATWKDKLVGYNGATLSYDAIGNLTSDGTWTYTWEKGRQLKQMSKSDTTIQFKYDHNGIRTQKIVTVNGTTTTTNYVYSGNKLVYMEQGNAQMLFYYDYHGHPSMVNYNGIIYSYIKNQQNDVIGIIDNSGSITVEYYYDAWGDLLTNAGSMANSLGELNPFRYRGYIFDNTTNLYFIFSRIYSVSIKRFLNIDTLINNGHIPCSHNLYTYCNNNPTINSDNNGKSAQNILADKIKEMQNTLNRFILYDADGVPYESYNCQGYVLGIKRVLTLKYLEVERGNEPTLKEVANLFMKQYGYANGLIRLSEPFNPYTDTIPDGYYLIIMCIGYGDVRTKDSPDIFPYEFDVHFMRCNEDGIVSHKQGTRPVHALCHITEINHIPLPLYQKGGFVADETFYFNEFEYFFAPIKR